MTRDDLRTLLETHDWRVSAVANALGVSRQRVQRLVQLHGLARPGAEPPPPAAPKSSARVRRRPGWTIHPDILAAAAKAAEEQGYPSASAYIEALVSRDVGMEAPAEPEQGRKKL